MELLRTETKTSYTDGIVAGSWRTCEYSCKVRLEVQTPKLNNPDFVFKLQSSEEKLITVCYLAVFSQSA